MKIYQVTMDDLRCEKISAGNAADAVQSALMKNPGHTVTACALRDLQGNGMNFDIPKHRALTREDIERLTPKREPRQQSTAIPGENKPAPWIQDWINKRKASAG